MGGGAELGHIYGSAVSCVPLTAAKTGSRLDLCVGSLPREGSARVCAGKLMASQGPARRFPPVPSASPGRPGNMSRYLLPAAERSVYS